MVVVIDLLLLFVWTGLAGSPNSDPPVFPVVDHVDLVEVNHYYDDQGKPVFDQLIFYNWDADVMRFNVVAWRLLKNPGQYPLRVAASGQYQATWHDGKILRLVSAGLRQETWTQYDPETYERKFLPKSKRTDLLRIDLRR